MRSDHLRADIGLATSAYPPSRERSRARHRAGTRCFREQPTPELARSAQLSLLSAISANERLRLRPASVDELRRRPALRPGQRGDPPHGHAARRRDSSPSRSGIFFGYVVGKPLGVVLGRGWPRGPRCTALARR